MIYAFLYLILIFGCIFYDAFGKEVFRKGWYIVEFVAIVLVAGLRYKVGGDTLAYHDEFDLLPSLDGLSEFDFSSSRYNVLWLCLTAVCKSIVNDFAFFQIVHALIVNSSFFFFFWRKTKWSFTAVLFYGLLYFFTFNTEVLRAAIAVSIFLWSWDFLVRKRWIPYFLCFLLAFGFHSESIMMLLLPIIHILSRIKVNKSYMIALVVITLVFAVFINFSSLFGRLSTVSEHMSDSITFYLDPERSGKVSFLGYGKFFVFQLPCLYFLWVSPNKYFKAVLTIYFFLIFQALHYSNLVQRELDFIYPVIVVAIADACGQARYAVGKNSLLLKLCTSASILLILFQQAIYYVADNRWLLFVPYSSIFNPVDNPVREELFYLLQNPM